VSTLDFLLREFCAPVSLPLTPWLDILPSFLTLASYSYFPLEGLAL